MERTKLMKYTLIALLIVLFALIYAEGMQDRQDSRRCLRDNTPRATPLFPDEPAKGVLRRDPS